MRHLLQVTVRLSNKPLYLLLVACIVTLLYLIYKFVRNLQRQRREFIMLKENFRKNVLQAEIKMQEQVLRDISQDVHDSIGQKLAVAKFYLMKNKEAQEQNKEVTGILGECINDLRDLSKSLSSDEVRNLGLVQAIREEITRLQWAEVFDIDFKVKGDPGYLNITVEITLFRIFQEALQNAVKHSGAQSFFAELCYEPKQVSLSITDNGRGFTDETSRGNGLKNMRDRAASVGGNLQILHLDPGTEIRATIPLRY